MKKKIDQVNRLMVMMPVGDELTDWGGGGGGGGGSPKTVDTSPSDKLVKKISQKEVTPPTSLQDLFSEDVFTSQLSVNAATELKIPFGAVDNKFSRKIFIQEYAKFIDIKEGAQSVRWGVSIRWIVNLKINNASAQISSLPMVAASAQVGYINASARFQVIGLSSSKITTLMPSPAELTIDTYVEMKNAFSSIKALIHDSTTIVKPQILSVLAEVNEEKDQYFQEVLAVSWALTCLQNGKSLANAQLKNKNQYFNETVKATYEQILDGTGLTNPKEAATKYLDGFKLVD